MLSGRRPALGLLVLGVMCLCAEARAESPDALYKRGVELRKAGKDAEALEVFKQLADAEKSPRAVGQMGLAEQALGVWVDAEAHVQEALASAGDAWIKKNKQTLDRALEQIRRRLGRLEIWGEPAGAEVLVDGKLVGTLPLSAPVRVVVGNMPITVRAAGYLERTTVMGVQPGETARERVVLQRAAEERPVVGTRPIQPPRLADADRPGGVRATQNDPTQLRDQPGSDGKPGALRGAAKWMAWGAGAVALGVGVFGTVRQGSLGSDFDASCALDASGTPRAVGGAKTDAQCADLKSSTDSAFTVEVIGFASAGVLAGAGLLLWLTEPSPSDEKRTSMRGSLACAPGLASATTPAISCALRF